jgi:WD40 repeat protein
MNYKFGCPTIMSDVAQSRRIPMGFNVRVLAPAALLITVACGPCAAGDKPARTDLHGDPLPPGAVARLGTSRLQHAGPVHTLVYSPDGKWLASAGEDKLIYLWDAETGKQSLSLTGHERAVRSLAFVPAGEGKSAKILASASDDRTIRFWDLETGKESRHIDHPGTATALAVSPDGKLLASGSYRESPIYLWNVEDGKEVRRWNAHQGGTMDLAFAPDGKTIASGGIAKGESLPGKEDDPQDDYRIALWQTDTGKPRHTFAGNTSIVRIAFSADGKLLASSGFHKTKVRSVILWDTESGKELRSLGGRVWPADPRCMAFTKDGKTLAAGDMSAIRLFDTGSGAEQGGMFGRTADEVQALAFSPDGRALASTGRNGRIIIWDVVRRTTIAGQGHTQPLNSVAVSPDGKTIVTTAYGEPALLWDRATGRPIRQLKQETKTWRAFPCIWCATFSPDSRTVALAHQRDGITLWGVPDGQLQRHIPEKNMDRIVSVAFSPDGKWLASESIDQPYASLWDTSTGKLKRTFERGTKRFEDRGTAVAISPNGRLLASTATNGLNVWRLDSGKLVFLKSGGGSSVAFSPGGLLVATAGPGVMVFDADTGTELAKFDAERYHGGSQSIAFSPDGRILAVADAQRIKLWDIAARRELPGFEGHGGIVTAVAFTPDGKALVSAAKDCTALIWDVGGLLPPVRKGDAKVQWNDLHDSDRLRAYAAFCRLRASPDDALALLKTNFKPAEAPASERLADLIKKLDNDSFEVRDRATEELKKLGIAAEKTLREAAGKKPSLEVAKRIEQLLDDLDTDWQRSLTALNLLEELPPASVHELLQSLAKGDPHSRLTREAKAMLERMPKRDSEPKP